MRVYMVQKLYIHLQEIEHPLTLRVIAAAQLEPDRKDYLLIGLLLQKYLTYIYWQNEEKKLQDCHDQVAH